MKALKQDKQKNALVFSCSSVFMSRPRESGQAALIAVLFFLAITTAVTIGFAQIGLAQARTSRDLTNSQKSFFVGESVIDDVVYRLSNSSAGDDAGLTPDNYSMAFTTYTPSISFKIQSSESWQEYSASVSVNNVVRRTKVLGSPASQARFTADMQAGYLGIELRNSADIAGDIYSNGPIVGTPGSPDQNVLFAKTYVSIAQGFKVPNTTASNVPWESGSAPSDTMSSNNFDRKLRVRDNVVRRHLAQQFVSDITAMPTKIRLYANKIGTPTSGLDIYIFENDPNLSDDPAGVSSRRAVGFIRNTDLDGDSSKFQWIDVILSNTKPLIAGKPYWLVISGSGALATNYYEFWGIRNQSSYSGSGYKSGYQKYNPLFNDQYLADAGPPSRPDQHAVSTSPESVSTKYASGNDAGVDWCHGVSSISGDLCANSAYSIYSSGGLAGYGVAGEGIDLVFSVYMGPEVVSLSNLSVGDYDDFIASNESPNTQPVEHPCPAITTTAESATNINLYGSDLIYSASYGAVANTFGTNCTKDTGPQIDPLPAPIDPDTVQDWIDNYANDPEKSENCSAYSYLCPYPGNILSTPAASSVVTLPVNNAKEAFVVNGDFTLSNRKLILRGIIYVKGNLIIDGDAGTNETSSCEVFMDPSYNVLLKGNTIPFIVEGSVLINNKCKINGKHRTGDVGPSTVGGFDDTMIYDEPTNTHIFIISRSSNIEETGPAVELLNNAQGDLFYAESGLAILKQSTKAKGLYAVKAILENSSVLKSVVEGPGNIIFPQVGGSEGVIFEGWSEF